jgi:hypothetical protein
MQGPGDLWQSLSQWLQDHLPAPLNAVPAWLLLLILVGGGLLVLLLFLVVVARLLFGGKKKPKRGSSNLEEDLSTYPPAPQSSGDRRLMVEGVPVRVRLVVIAPAGTESEVSQEEVESLLDRLLPGLGDVVRHDKPRVRQWPTQVSYQGFATHFHRNMLTPEAEGEMSPWVLVAGRAKVGKTQFMLGLALQALKPTPAGRMTLEAHEWTSKLRVRVRE